MYDEKEKDKDMICGTWNVRTLFKSGAVISLHSQIRVEAWHNSTTGNRVAE